MSQTMTRTTGVDVRPVSRWFAALILPIGPAAIALLRYFLPYDTVDHIPTITDKFVNNLDRGSLVLWLGFIGILTLVPGAYVVGRLTRRRAPWLTAIALLLVVPGYLALPWLASSDIFVWSAGTAGLDPAAITRATEVAHPTMDIAGFVFVAGHVIGTILLGIAMWRSGVGPRWAAVATAISQPLHAIAAIVLASHTLDLAAWGLQAAGFAAVGWVILRMRDEDWEPALTGTK
jgi:hypothetical protein